MIAALLLLLAQPVQNPHSLQCESPRDAEEAALCEEFLAPEVAEEPPEPDDDCDDPQDQIRMNFCASLEFGVAEAALDAQFEMTLEAMQAADDEIDRAYDDLPSYSEALLESQRAWLAYRDHQCQSEGFSARGGSLQPLIEAHCRTYLTELRTEQLRNLAAGLE